jgi:hypothetical protein
MVYDSQICLWLVCAELLKPVPHDGGRSPDVIGLDQYEAVEQADFTI